MRWRSKIHGATNVESVERISDPPMNETSINSAVVPALIYLNPNQAPNTAQSKTALAVSGKYWNTNTMQYSKKNILYRNVYFVTRTAYWLRFFLADEWYLDNHEDQRSMFWSPVTSSGLLPPSLSSSENPFRHLEVLSQFQKTNPFLKQQHGPSAAPTYQ